MHNVTFAGDIDVVSLILYSLFAFFLGLVLYLRREDRREGYPLEDDVTGALETTPGFLFIAQPKAFLLADGVVSKPDGKRDSADLKAQRTSVAPGSPIEPVGDPMLAGVGPGSFAQRERKAEQMLHGGAKIVPLRVATAFHVVGEANDPRGMKAVCADHLVAGVVTDVWVDQAEALIRYLEVELASDVGTGKVLVPMTMAVLQKAKREVQVSSVLAHHFGTAPKLANPNEVTKDEEERIVAYFGGGLLYAHAQRMEPLL